MTDVPDQIPTILVILIKTDDRPAYQSGYSLYAKLTLTAAWLTVLVKPALKGNLNLDQFQTVLTVHISQPLAYILN